MKRVIKKLATLGLACSMIIASSVTVMAEYYPVNDSAGNTNFSGRVYVNPDGGTTVNGITNGRAGAYVSANETCDLYIEDAYASNNYDQKRSFSASAEQNTYTSAYVVLYEPTYARANFVCCSNDGGYNKVFANVYRKEGS